MHRLRSASAGRPAPAAYAQSVRERRAARRSRRPRRCAAPAHQQNRFTHGTVRLRCAAVFAAIQGAAAAACCTAAAAQHSNRIGSLSIARAPADGGRVLVVSGIRSKRNGCAVGRRQSALRQGKLSQCTYTYLRVQPDEVLERAHVGLDRPLVLKHKTSRLSAPRACDPTDT